MPVSAPMGTVLLANLQELLGGLCSTIAGRPGTLPLGEPQLVRDVQMCGVFAVSFFVALWATRLALLEKATRLFLPSMRTREVTKFVQSATEVAVYGGFVILGLFVVPSQPWVWPSSQWWENYSEGGHKFMRSDLRCYYIVYIARYAQAAVSLFLENRRKDFFEMLAHHVLTVIVSCISYAYGFNRVGAVIMLLQDIADVPLHLAKMCKYTSDATHGRVSLFLADRLFEVFAVVFFVTRIIMFSYACWSALIETGRYFPRRLPEWSCITVLYCLLMLQVYWFILIIKVAAKIIRGDNAVDPRSDDEDENDTASSEKRPAVKKKAQ